MIKPKILRTLKKKRLKHQENRLHWKLPPFNTSQQIVDTKSQRTEMQKPAAHRTLQHCTLQVAVIYL